MTSPEPFWRKEKRRRLERSHKGLLEMFLIEPRLAVHVGVFSASSKSESLASQFDQFAVLVSVE